MFDQGDRPITPHIANAAAAFGAYAVRVTRPDEIGPALRDALAAKRPAVIEVMVDMGFGTSGGLAPGWWDVPIPEYFRAQHEAYLQARREERV